MAGAPLLEVVDLALSYGETPALRAISFRVGRGQVVGIVGESGSGKSSVGAAILRLLPPAARIMGGRILFDGRDLLLLSQKEMRRSEEREYPSSRRTRSGRSSLPCRLDGS